MSPRPHPRPTTEWQMEDAVHRRASLARGPQSWGSTHVSSLSRCHSTPTSPPSPCTPAKPSGVVLDHSCCLRPGPFPGTTGHWGQSWPWPGLWWELPLVLRQSPGGSQHCPSTCRSQECELCEARPPTLRAESDFRAGRCKADWRRSERNPEGPGIERGGAEGRGRFGQTEQGVFQPRGGF